MLALMGRHGPARPLAPPDRGKLGPRRLWGPGNVQIKASPITAWTFPRCHRGNIHRFVSKSLTGTFPCATSAPRLAAPPRAG